VLNLERSRLEKGKKIPVCISVATPGVMDAIRISVRTVITRSADKIFPFPSVEELVLRVLTILLEDDVHVVPEAQAKVKVPIIPVIVNFYQYV
jgi:hypothetical protein